MKRILTFVFIFLSSLFSTEVREENLVELKASHQIDAKHTHEQLKHLFALDVLKYFQLNWEYDTPLKVKEFKKTPEYAALLAEMQAQMRRVREIDFTLDISEVSSYDLKKGQFLISLDFTKNPMDQYIVEEKGFDGWTKTDQLEGKYGVGDRDGYFPNAIDGFWFPSFKFKSEKNLERNTIYGPEEGLSHLPIKVPESIAIRIEKEHGRVRIKYNIKNQVKKKVKYDRTVLDGHPAYHHIEFLLFECNIRQINFINEQGEVLFTAP